MCENVKHTKNISLQMQKCLNLTNFAHVTWFLTWHCHVLSGDLPDAFSAKSIASAITHSPRNTEDVG